MPLIIGGLLFPNIKNADNLEAKNYTIENKYI